MILAVKKVDRLEQLKAELLEVLETREMDLKKCLFFKSIMAVGQLSTYKDGSVWRKIQANLPKWKCIKPARTQNTKGLKFSIGALKNKIKDCNDIGTLHAIVIANKDRFLDSDGKPLEVYKEVVKEFRKQKLLLQIKGQRLNKEDNRELKKYAIKDNIRKWTDRIFSEKIKGSREEIFKKCNTEKEEIGKIDSKLLSLFRGVTDNRIYCSEAYFVDHIVNHHPELSKKEVVNMLNLLNSNEIYKEFMNNSIVFVGRSENKYLLLALKEDEGKLILWKTFYKAKKLSAKWYKIDLAKLQGRESRVDSLTTIGRSS